VTDLRTAARYRVIFLAMLGAMPLVAACGSSSPSTASPVGTAGQTSGAAPSSPAVTTPAGGSSAAAVSGRITVFAAASLTGSFTAIGKAFEAAHPGTSVTFSFGASSTLAMQVTSGAPADVFASASPKNLASVVSAGDADPGQTFATNTAEIAVNPGSKSNVTGLADLAKGGVKVSLCQPQVPCGVLADAVLGKAGVTVNPVTRGLDVKTVLASVTSGEVDAGIVYVTDVKAAGSAVVGVAVPAADNASTAYPISVVKHTKNPALARAFTAYVLSDAGQSVLTQAGFTRP